MTVAARIKSGQVYINTYGAGGGVELPFGGYKKSGYGREKGLDSLASYLQIKNVCVKFSGLPQSVSSAWGKWGARWRRTSGARDSRWPCST
jgi:hypothetical protein